MNTALFRPCVSNAGPQSAFGGFMHDRGPEWKGSRYHLGLDVPLAQGTQLYGSGSGTVTRISKTEKLGYIWIVEVTYDVAGGRFVVQTHHMSRIDVTLGQHITTATRLGLSGGARNTMGAGNSTGPHVHIQTYSVIRGVRTLVDPDDYLQSRSRISTGGTPVPLPEPIIDPFKEGDMPQYIFTPEDGNGYALIDSNYRDGLILTGDPTQAAQMSWLAWTPENQGAPVVMTRSAFNAKCAAAVALWRAHAHKSDAAEVDMQELAAAVIEKLAPTIATDADLDTMKAELLAAISGVDEATIAQLREKLA